MKYVLFCAWFLALIGPARAEDLLYDNACSTTTGTATPISVSLVAPTDTGRTCEELRKYDDDINMIRAALMPVSTALLLAPGAKSMIVTQLSRLGITYANPAVLGVTLIGATGVTVVYFILQKKLADCAAMDREQLKEQIEDELQRKFGLQSPPDMTLDISN